MNDKVKELLEGELESEINNLSSLEPGSDEHAKAVDSLVKLYKLKIDEDKNSIDSYDKNARLHDERTKFDKELTFKESQYNKDLELREKQISNDAESNEEDKQFKRDQLKEQIIDRYFKLGIEVAGLVFPLMFYACWMRRGFKFEETGTYTSNTFRNLINNFKPKRK